MIKGNLYKPAINAAIIFGLLAVILGAIGTHIIDPSILPERWTKSFETAIRYQFYHCFALLFSGLLYLLFPGRLIKWATWSFVIGIILFCGSIFLNAYLLLEFKRGLGIFSWATPFGGIFLIAGWIFLFLGIQNKRKWIRQKQKDAREKDL